MPPKTTRTLNPLHFEDLEPHRFEDMVRQLAYDFRAWNRIEPTGRLGGDDGIDIRAVEGGEISSRADEGDEQDEEAQGPRPERVWVIQCKREKKLGPADVKKIVQDGVPSGGDTPYGFILAAACDFSKKAQDDFHAEARSRGVREAHLWGKATLEDMLFLPKYDHLLFAYFNISLQVRRRSLRASVRSRIATKKVAIRTLGPVRGARQHRPVLIRDTGASGYPWPSTIADFERFPRWFYVWFRGHQPPDHLTFVRREHFAYIHDDGEQWDFIDDFPMNCQSPVEGFSNGRSADFNEQRTKFAAPWYKLPERNKGMLRVLCIVHYDRVLAIDEEGDSFHPGPHVLVDFDKQHGPFEAAGMVVIESDSHSLRLPLYPKADKRVSFFPSIVTDDNQGPGGEERKMTPA
jgi:hypothetical protein